MAGLLPETAAWTQGEEMPSRTWKINWEENRIDGVLDGKEALQQAAAIREEYPTEPLKELAAHFPYPISKSGLSHRMKKLEALAAELEEASHGN